jgi:hypothetical protein
MSARRQKLDPVIAAWDRLQAAEKAQSQAYDESGEAEARARKAGFDPRLPAVCIQGYRCLSLTEAKRRARGLPKDKANAAVEAMRAALADRQRRRGKAGLAPYDAAVRRTIREWRAAMQAMAHTRATTPAGVILKLKLIALELRDGKTNYGESILASAIADLTRMDRK